MAKSLAKNAAFNTVYRVLNILFPVVSSMYLARVLLPAGVGTVAYAQTIAQYFVSVAALGIPSYGTREIARVCGDREATDRTFSELFLINLASTLIAFAAYLGVLGALFAGSEDFSVHLTFALLVALNALNVDWVYQGHEEYVYISVRSIIVKTASLVAIFLLVRGEQDVVLYALFFCLGSAGNYLFNAFRLGRLVRLTLKGLDFGRHMRSIVTLFAVSIAADLYSRLDITMLGAMGLSSAAGIYSNAQQIVNAALSVLLAMTGVFLPRLSALIESDRDRFRELVSRGFNVIVFVGAPLLVGLDLVAPGGVIALYGESFAASGRVVLLLSPLLAIKGIGDLMCYQVLLAARRESLFLPSRIVGAVVNALLNYLLIPVLQQDGAAIASVASEFALNLPLLIVALRIVRPKMGRHTVFSILASVAVMALCVIVVERAVVDPVPQLLAGVGVAVVSYACVSLLTRNEMALRLVGRIRGRTGNGG